MVRGIGNMRWPGRNSGRRTGIRKRRGCKMDRLGRIKTDSGIKKHPMCRNVCRDGIRKHHGDRTVKKAVIERENGIRIMPLTVHLVERVQRNGRLTHRQGVHLWNLRKTGKVSQRNACFILFFQFCHCSVQAVLWRCTAPMT